MNTEKREKILVADDMMMDREVLTELLDGEYDVTAVADGGEAVRELDAHPGEFACVLTDIFMPVLDGFGVLAHMKEKGYTTPVIALTSMTDSDGHIRCYEAGVSEILEKPYDRKILMYKVRRMIGQREKAAPAPEAAAPAAAPASSVQLKYLQAFDEDFGRTLELLRKAIAEHDEVGLHTASHAFKGLKANLGILLECC